MLQRSNVVREDGQEARSAGDARISLREFLDDQLRWYGSQRGLADAIGISQGTVQRLLHEAVVPKESTLRKIAAEFQLPITEVRRMARRSVGEGDPFTWPEEFDQLPRRVRAALIELGWACLDMAAERVTRGS